MIAMKYTVYDKISWKLRYTNITLSSIIIEMIIITAEKKTRYNYFLLTELLVSRRIMRKTIKFGVTLNHAT